MGWLERANNGSLKTFFFFCSDRSSDYDVLGSNWLPHDNGCQSREFVSDWTINCCSARERRWWRSSPMQKISVRCPDSPSKNDQLLKSGSPRSHCQWLIGNDIGFDVIERAQLLDSFEWITPSHAGPVLLPCFKHDACCTNGQAYGKATGADGLPIICN